MLLNVNESIYVAFLDSMARARDRTSITFIACDGLLQRGPLGWAAAATDWQESMGGVSPEIVWMRMVGLAPLLPLIIVSWPGDSMAFVRKIDEAAWDTWWRLVNKLETPDLEQVGVSGVVEFWHQDPPRIVGTHDRFMSTDVLELPR